MKKYFALIFGIGLIFWSCRKDDPVPNTTQNNSLGLGATQPWWDGFYLDLYVYDTLGIPMDSVSIESIELPFNGRQCGNDEFITDSTGHCLACVMYGRSYDSPPNPQDSQKFALSYESVLNEIEFEVVINDTTLHNHYYQF